MHRAPTPHRAKSMAPKKQEMTKKEGKRPMEMIDKEKKMKKVKEEIVLETVFMQNTNQNPKHPTEKVVGWCITDTKRKKGAVVWYLAKTSGDFMSSQTAVLTKPSGHGKPPDFPPSTLSSKDLAGGRYVVLDPPPCGLTSAASQRLRSCKRARARVEPAQLLIVTPLR